MKNLTILLLLSLTINALSAQNPGCDGIRYKSDVFSNVKKTTLVYGPSKDHQNENINLSMDVYEPEGDALSARPVVVLAHGGSFMFGVKTDMQAYCQALAKQGYVAASIQYRLYPFFILGFPDSLGIFDTATKAIGDMKAAVRFFREDAATNNQFRVDPANIFIGGYSAGAVTALTAAYLDANDNIPTFLQSIIAANGGLEGVTGTNSNKTYASTAKAVLSMSGGIYRSNWIESTEAPVQSIHGTADGTVNYNFGLAANIAFLEGSKLIHDRANAVGLQNNLITVPGGGHSDIYSQASFKPFLDSFLLKSAILLESLSCQAVNTAEIIADEDWGISPNPSAAGIFTLRLSEEIPTATLYVVDGSGRLLLRQEQNSNNTSINLGNIPAGNYWIGIETTGKKIGGKLWTKL